MRSSQRTGGTLIALAEDIILVDEGHLRLEFLVDFTACSGDVWRVRRVDVREVTIVCGEIVKHRVTNESMIVAHVEVGGVTVVFPVSHTVSNHETAEVWLPVSWLSIGDVSVNAKCQLRDIDPSI